MVKKVIKTTKLKRLSIDIKKGVNDQQQKTQARNKTR